MTDRVTEALRLVSAMSRAPTVTKARDLFEQAIEPFGVKLYTLHSLINPYRMTQEHIIRNWPEEWARFYDGALAFHFDPVVREQSKQSMFFWREATPATKQEAQLMRDAAEIGMSDGFSAVRIVPGEAGVAASMGGIRLEWSEVDTGVAAFVSTSFMARVLYLRDLADSQELKELTKTEMRMLHYAALGRHDKEIARDLHLTPSTIWTYWRNIRRKLKAQDRASAVAKAIFSRTLLP